MKVILLMEFARIIYHLLKSDRDVTLGVGGFTGEGKSTFLTKLMKDYATISQTYWGFDRMTWSRNELMTWIDGEKDTRKGQLPEYSCILIDELFSLFYRRKWYEEGQIDSIATFNMCRDRHLLIGGNIPDFWDLDGGFTSRVRFYIYIPFRGVAWVFEQENNPFSSDKWNATENRKIFRKNKNPFKCPNFLMQINFDDWETEEKIEYYQIRNEKRLKAIDQNKPERIERYKDIKEQRNKLIRWIHDIDKTILGKEVGQVIGMDGSMINKIIKGII